MKDKKTVLVQGSGGGRPIDIDDYLFIPSGCISSLKGEICINELNNFINNVKSFIETVELSTDGNLKYLRVNPTTPLSNVVFVNPGNYRINSNSETEIYPGGYSPMFQPIILKPRIDLLCIDDNANLSIIQGAENMNPVPPQYPYDKLVLAEIYIDETLNVTISKNDIKDARDILGSSTVEEIDGGTFT